jgi:hypothetical protein
MGKLGIAAIVVLAGAVAGDQYWNFGFYTDGTLSALNQIRHSFGW